MTMLLLIPRRDSIYQMTNIYLTLTLVFQTLYVLHVLVPPISGDVQKRDSASENPTGNARGVFADLRASRKFISKACSAAC
jgi:hypothetical protein